jgi:tRNA(Ser,Leu) C12 N-acetylase TAN1
MTLPNPTNLDPDIFSLHISKFDKDAMVSRIVELVNMDRAPQDRHIVNLTSPEKVVLVEINQALCGLTIVSGGPGVDHAKLHDFNIRHMQDSVRAEASLANEPTTTTLSS